MTKLVTVTRGRAVWLACDWVDRNGRPRRTMLHQQGFVGDCMRPGQRVNPARVA